MLSFNLDEYVGIANDSEDSYHKFMADHLFNKVDIKLVNTYFPGSEGGFDELIAQKGGIDLQILGIGTNGHVGFNEPGSAQDSLTRVVDLTPGTIQVNADKFFNGDTTSVPKTAYSMGLKSIMNAKEIILLAYGPSKKEALAGLKAATKFDINNPSSVLVDHANVTVVFDEAAE